MGIRHLCCKDLSPNVKYKYNLHRLTVIIYTFVVSSLSIIAFQPCENVLSRMTSFLWPSIVLFETDTLVNSFRHTIEVTEKSNKQQIHSYICNKTLESLTGEKLPLLSNTFITRKYIFLNHNYHVIINHHHHHHRLKPYHQQHHNYIDMRLSSALGKIGFDACVIAD